MHEKVKTITIDGVEVHECCMHIIKSTYKLCTLDIIYIACVLVAIDSIAISII